MGTVNRQVGNREDIWDWKLVNGRQGRIKTGRKITMNNENSETNKTKTADKTRPTKKQHQTLDFIRHFIVEHGYSPSYREIMNGCNYTSVATVSLHVNSLIKRGHIVKRSKSARSLEVVDKIEESSSAKSNHKHEIIAEIDSRFKKLEQEFQQDIMNEVYVLVGALKIMGHMDLARAYAGQINEVSVQG